jgi:hypothetical protein
MAYLWLTDSVLHYNAEFIRQNGTLGQLLSQRRGSNGEIDVALIVSMRISTCFHSFVKLT